MSRTVDEVLEIAKRIILYRRAEGANTNLVIKDNGRESKVYSQVLKERRSGPSHEQIQVVLDEREARAVARANRA